MAGVQQRAGTLSPGWISSTRSIRDALANEYPIRNTCQNRSLAASTAQGVGTRRRLGVNSATRLLLQVHHKNSERRGEERDNDIMSSVRPLPFDISQGPPRAARQENGYHRVRPYRPHPKKRGAVKGFQLEEMGSLTRGPSRIDIWAYPGYRCRATDVSNTSATASEVAGGAWGLRTLLRVPGVKTSQIASRQTQHHARPRRHRHILTSQRRGIRRVKFCMAQWWHIQERKSAFTSPRHRPSLRSPIVTVRTHTVSGEAPSDSLAVGTILTACEIVRGDARDMEGAE